ncbi:hypothetical protein CSUI_006765 [Cystoisospora suis]|uniref:Uncharacterized protein n=1 Tax=Cystoisospora suis TaxID=483139 RepID=A0A2C6KQN4_9APIC|nr:hypothetical protein CSUI_006765 [Cystoisospora suis]
MAAQMCFAASLRSASLEASSVGRHKSPSLGWSRKNIQEDGSTGSQGDFAFTPYTLRTGLGRRHSPRRAERREGISPTGQYIRRSIYSSEDDSTGKARPDEGRTLSTPSSARGAGPLRTSRTPGVDRSPKDTSPLRTVSPAPASSATEVERDRGVDRVRQELLSNQRDLTTVKAELRRLASPYVVTRTDPSADQRNTSLRLERPRTHDGRLGTKLSDEFPGMSTADKTAQSVPPSSRSHHVSLRFRDKDTSPQTTEQRPGEERVASVEPLGSAVLQPSKKGIPLPAEDKGNTHRAQEPGGFPQSRKAHRVHGSSALKRKGDLAGVSPEATIPEGEKRRFRAAWKEALGQLAARMDEWVQKLPAEVQRQVTEASGVDAKFLALRDCALALCRAAEMRALGLSEVRKKNEEFKRSLKSEQRNAETMLVEVRGRMLAASEKVKQLRRLVCVTTARPSASLPPEPSKRLTHASGEEYPVQQGCYTSYTSVYSPDLGSPCPGEVCYPALIDSHNAFSEPAIKRYSSCSSCPATARIASPLGGGTRQISQESVSGSGGAPIITSCGSTTPPDGNIPRLLSPILETSTPASNLSSRETETQKDSMQTPVPNSFSHDPCPVFSGERQPVSTACASIFPEAAPVGTVLNEDVSWASNFIAEWQSRRK